MDIELSARLRNSGLDVLGKFEGGGPTVTDAFHRVAHIDAVPIQRISVNEPDATRKLGESWKFHALQGGVLASDGSFLVAGGLNYGWVQVRLTDATDISALEDTQGELLFMARSLRGHRVCAASKEEGEYWILEADLAGD
jgi:hypothetical protein